MDEHRLFADAPKAVRRQNLADRELNKRFLGAHAVNPMDDGARLFTKS